MEHKHAWTIAHSLRLITEKATIVVVLWACPVCDEFKVTRFEGEL